ncbi:MAG TPA: Uma2 family endonuclease [Gemmatimonadaceae bacterium]|nr:Uma2 family endonuclease [Gemmatimonadaceae bacterium]
MSMAVVNDTSHKHWTAADRQEIADDRNRYEIIDGELFVTPSPSWAHQRLTRELLRLIGDYLRTHRLGEVLSAPADVTLTDDTVVEPDLFVVPLVEGRPAGSWVDVRRLLLVIEILSPATAHADRTVKRRRYQREGVPEYWIVDGDARLVERWRPEDERPEMISDRLEWKPAAAMAPLVVDLAKLFEAALWE